MNLNQHYKWLLSELTHFGHEVSDNGTSTQLGLKPKVSCLSTSTEPKTKYKV